MYNGLSSFTSGVGDGDCQGKQLGLIPPAAPTSCKEMVNFYVLYVGLCMSALFIKARLCLVSRGYGYH